MPETSATPDSPIAVNYFPAFTSHLDFRDMGSAVRLEVRPAGSKMIRLRVVGIPIMLAAIEFQIAMLVKACLTFQQMGLFTILMISWAKIGLLAAELLIAGSFLYLTSGTLIHDGLTVLVATSEQFELRRDLRRRKWRASRVKVISVLLKRGIFKRHPSHHLIIRLRWDFPVRVSLRHENAELADRIRSAFSRILGLEQATFPD